LELQGKKESELKKEISRFSSALEALNNPNISKEQVADLLVLNHEAAEMNRQSTLYRQKMATTSKILKSHMDNLKTKGVQIEN